MHLFCDLQQVAGSEAILYHPIAALMDSANLTFGLWDTLTYPHPLTYPHTLTYTPPTDVTTHADMPTPFAHGTSENGIGGTQMQWDILNNECFE